MGTQQAGRLLLPSLSLTPIGRTPSGRRSSRRLTKAPNPNYANPRRSPLPSASAIDAALQRKYGRGDTERSEFKKGRAHTIRKAIIQDGLPF